MGNLFVFILSGEAHYRNQLVGKVVAQPPMRCVHRYVMSVRRNSVNGYKQAEKYAIKIIKTQHSYLTNAHCLQSTFKNDFFLSPNGTQPNENKKEKRRKRNSENSICFVVEVDR